MLNLDPTLLGVIIGSLLTLAGNILTQLFSLKREEKHWDRQQKAEEKRSDEIEEKQMKERLQNLYKDCISSLSVMMSAGSDRLGFSQEELKAIHKESLDVIALLSIHRASIPEVDWRSFDDTLANYINSPVTYASGLLSIVQDLAMSDKVLFPNAVQRQVSPIMQKCQFLLDDEFRRQQIIEGHPVNPTIVLEYDPLKITPSQREKILNQSQNNIPKKLILHVPIISDDNDKVILRGHQWKAKVNPNHTSVESIFDEWEKDYEEAMDRITDLKLELKDEK